MALEQTRALPRSKRYFGEVITASGVLPKTGIICVAENTSGMANQELLATIRDRYRASSRKDKSWIFDESVPVTDHHRKHSIRRLTSPPTTQPPRRPAPSRSLDRLPLHVSLIVCHSVATTERQHPLSVAVTLCTQPDLSGSRPPRRPLPSPRISGPTNTPASLR